MSTCIPLHVNSNGYRAKLGEGSNLGKDRRRRFCEKPYAFRLLWRR